jgi:hypothetical protein
MDLFAQSKIDQLYRDAEDVLTAHFGEASDDEEYANVADAIMGDLIDHLRGAVDLAAERDEARANAQIAEVWHDAAQEEVERLRAEVESLRQRLRGAVSPYPWLTHEGADRWGADMRGCTNAERDRRLVILQEVQSGRLVPASTRGAV